MSTLSAIQVAQLDPQRMPRHVAIIMDGNGRWARSQGWRRVRGHEQGAKVVREVVTESVALGMDYLTLYAFSSENWSRPQTEVDYLMRLLGRFLDRELDTLMDNNVRLKAIGELDRLPSEVADRLFDRIEKTATNDAMTLSLAVSYGSRDELVRACRHIAEKAATGQLDPASINIETIDAHLYDTEAPDVDLLIRTAGEMRISNFLLWQIWYAEYVSVRDYWPSLTISGYHEALREYQSRQRRFGGLTNS